MGYHRRTSRHVAQLLADRLSGVAGNKRFGETYRTPGAPVVYLEESFGRVLAIRQVDVAISGKAEVLILCCNGLELGREHSVDRCASVARCKALCVPPDRRNPSSASASDSTRLILVEGYAHLIVDQ